MSLLLLLHGPASPTQHPVVSSYSQLILVEGEQDQAVRTDHNKRLIGRAGAAVAAAGLAAIVAATSLVLVDEAQDAVRQNHSLLNRFRTQYQTVGQSYRLWPKASQQSDVEEFQRAKPADLNVFRSTTQKAGQPWMLRLPAQRRIDAEDFQVLNAGAAVSQAIAPGPTSGQPWSLWVKPQQRVEAEDFTVLNSGTFASPQAIAQTVTPNGAPFFLWVPPVPQDVEELDHRVDNSLLNSFRKTLPTALPGQPWHMRMPPQKRVDAEEYAVLNAGTFASPQAIAQTLHPGQPWFMRMPAQRRIDAEDFLVQNIGSFATPQAITPVTPVNGAPFFVWVPPVSQDVEEYTVPRQSTFALTRVTRAPVVLPGQPWFTYRAAVADQTVEPNPVVKDHAQALYPFRPHPAIVPVIPTGNGGGGYWEKKRKKRHLVTVDGKTYSFSSAAEASKFLPDVETESPNAVKKRAKGKFSATQQKLEKSSSDPIRVDIPSLAEFATRIGQAPQFDHAMAAQEWAALARMYEHMRDEEDIEMLLLHDT